MYKLLLLAAAVLIAPASFGDCRDGNSPSHQLEETLKDHVRREVGPIAVPAKIEFVKQLPKTRSGKIMRRILRKIGEGEIDQLGDISTLADPSVVDQLVAGRQ